MKDWRYRVKYESPVDKEEFTTGAVSTISWAKSLAEAAKLQGFLNIRIIDDNAGEVWRYSDGKKTA